MSSHAQVAPCALSVFNFRETNPVRVIVGASGEPLFAASDVAVTLGYANPQKAVRDHCKKAKSLIDMGGTIRSPQLDQQLKFIPESDVYRLVLRSKLESAEAFQDWLVEEVVPSIRRNGMYATDELLDDPEHLLKVTQRLVDERRMRLEAEGRASLAERALDEAQPAVKFQEEVAADEHLEFTVRDVCKTLFNGGVPEKAVRESWRTLQWTNLDGMPSAKALKQGLMRSRLDTTPVGKRKVAVLTGKGLAAYRHVCRDGDLFSAKPRCGLVLLAGGAR